MNDVDKTIEYGREVGSAWTRSPKWLIFIVGIVTGALGMLVLRLIAAF